MRKYISILLVSLFITSCSKDNCDQQLEQLQKDYVNSINNTNGSNTALSEITRQYEAKKQQILKDCE